MRTLRLPSFKLQLRPEIWNRYSYPIVMLLFALASAVQTTVMNVKENYGFSAMSLMGAGWALQDSGTEQAFDMAMVGLVCLVVPGIVIKYKVWKQNGERETE